MSDFMKYIPCHLQAWAQKLSGRDIARMLTLISGASVPVRTVEVKVEPSAKIGKIGEAQVYDVLRTQYSVNDTSKSKRRGDFIITINGVRILIEVKKWKATIARAEVEKFYRDIDANASINGGLIISLTSKFVGQSTAMSYDCYLTSVGNKVPVVFLSFNSLQNCRIDGYIFMALDLLTSSCKSIANAIDINSDISNAVNSMSTNLDMLSTCRSTIGTMQANSNKQYANLMQCIMAAEVNMLNSINHIKSMISTRSQDVKSRRVSYNANKPGESDDEANEPLPPYINSPLVTYDPPTSEETQDTEPRGSPMVVYALDTKTSVRIKGLLFQVCENNVFNIATSGNTLISESGNVKIAVTKTTARVTFIQFDAQSLPPASIKGWTYDGKSLMVVLNNKSLEFVLNNVC